MDAQNTKNLILAMVLSFLVLFGWTLLFPPPEIDQTQIETETTVLNDSKKIKSDSLIPSVSGTTETSLVAERVKINTKRLSGSIWLKGGRIDDLDLNDYKVSLKSDASTVTLLERDYLIHYGWQDNNRLLKAADLPGPNTIWELKSGTILTENSPITLQWSNSKGLIFQRLIEVDENYMFSVTQEVINNSSSKLEIYPYRLIKRINTPKTINFFILHEGLISLVNDELLEKNYDDLLDDCSSSITIKDDFCDEKGQGGWLGFTDKYWMSVLIPDPKEPININYRHGNNGRDNYRTGYVGQIFKIAPGESIQYDGKLFAGAKKLDILSNYDKTLSIPRFTDAIDWGWFAFLTKPVSYSINWFFGYVGNFGLAIIAFTILMRLILFPLAHASFKSMAKMKKLQPEMQRLKETYPNDRQKMQQELMALYKREGANPVAGCLPILVQIPIFFSLYKVLFVTIEMYHAPFYGWIHDLSAPDPLGILILFGLVPWDVPPILSIVNIGILPIIMGLTMWLQQKLNPAPTDPTQAKIFALLPFVFTFVLAGFAAGLVLYWSVNNILSIAQQWFIQRKILAKNE